MPSNSPFPVSSSLYQQSTVGQIYEWENGEKYQGEFFKNSFHGKGIYIWSDKVSYSGFFYVNKRHGYGRQEFSDGRTYTGLYKDDMQYGVGLMEYPNNTEDVGFWKGSLLLRLCSAHPSIPTFSEIAIGYTTGADKVKKTIDMLAETRKPDPVDEYLDSSEVGSKLSSTIRESLFNSCVTNPESMFFNRRLFELVFQKSVAFEKKQILKASQAKTEKEVPLKTTKPFKLTTQPEIFKTKPRKPAVRATMEDMDVDEGPYSEDLSLDGSIVPDYTDIKPDYPSTIVSWNNDQQLIDLQKHTVRFQNFLVCVGFPVDKMMSFSRESMKPPGEVETASNYLLQLAFVGDASSALRLFLNQSVHPNVCDAKGNTALLIASLQCHEEMITSLLDMGADPNSCNDDGLTPIGMCLVQLHPATTLIYNFSNVRIHVEEVIAECNLQSVEKTERKLKTVHDLDAASPTREVPGRRRTRTESKKSMGARPGQEEISAPLPKPKVRAKSTGSKTAPSAEKETPLIDDRNCHQRIVPSDELLFATLKLLLSRGAEADLVLVPANPVMLAVRAGHDQLLRVLLEYGANPNIYHTEKDFGRFTPLHLACSLPAESAVLLTTNLLEQGANPDLPALQEDDRQHSDELNDNDLSNSTAHEKSVSSEGLTAILIASARPDYEVAFELVRVLLRFKCNPSPPLFYGHSPLSVAIANGDEMVIKALLTGGADPNRALNEEVGPIIATVLSAQCNYRWPIGKRLQIVRDLITAKADVVGPFKLGINKKVGSVVDFLGIMYFQESKEGKSHLTDYEKRLVIEQLTSFVKNSIRSVINYNRSNMTLRYKIIDEMSQKGTNDNSTGTLRKLPPNMLPMELCYECCKSCGLALHACTRCYSVVYCSKFCQMRSWDDCHKDECFINKEIPVQFLKKLAQRITFD